MSQLVAPAAHRVVADTGLLVVSGLTKSYGERRALVNVTIVVQPGRVVGLLGANGAGKTTAIRCLAGLLVPDSGTVRLCGTEVGQHGLQLGCLLGFAAQEVSLYPDLSARTNLRLFGRLTGMSRVGVDNSIAELEALIDLEPLLETPVRTLSGGQKRLVHVATALVHRPRLVVLDEPTNGLDITSRYDLLRTIRTVARAGAGVLLSSHQLTDIESVCDDVIILHDGAVLLAGPLAEVVAAHGEHIVEVRAGGRVQRIPDARISDVLPDLTNLSSVESISVVNPSLESVFLKMTGLRISAGGNTQ